MWCVGLLLGFCDLVIEIEFIIFSMFVSKVFVEFVMNGGWYFVIVKVMNGVGV